MDLEGQTIEFKCPICGSRGETDLPYRSPEERENLDLDLDQPEDELENIEEFEELLIKCRHVLWDRHTDGFIVFYFSIYCMSRHSSFDIVN